MSDMVRFFYIRFDGIWAACPRNAAYRQQLQRIMAHSVQHHIPTVVEETIPTKLSRSDPSFFHPKGAPRLIMIGRQNTNLLFLFFSPLVGRMNQCSFLSLHVAYMKENDNMNKNTAKGTCNRTNKRKKYFVFFRLEKKRKKLGYMCLLSMLSVMCMGHNPGQKCLSNQFCL